MAISAIKGERGPTLNGKCHKKFPSFFNPSLISWVMALDSILCPDTRCPVLLCCLGRGCVACKNACLGCRMQITSCVPVLCNVFLKARMHVLETEHLICYGTQCPVLLCYYMWVRVCLGYRWCLMLLDLMIFVRKSENTCTIVMGCCVKLHKNERLDYRCSRTCCPVLLCSSRRGCVSRL